MIAPGADLKIYMATRPVDFRRGLDGLAAAAQAVHKYLFLHHIHRLH